MQQSLEFFCIVSLIIASETYAMEQQRQLPPDVQESEQYREQRFGKAEDAAFQKLERRARRSKKRSGSCERVNLFDIRNSK